MENARPFRRAKLAAEIQRRRHSLSAMRFAQENSTSATKEHFTQRLQELSEELERMEREYHALNVEQIRDELANG
jgi:hypothetical protein